MLEPEDFLHCHYRDKAVLIARGVPIVEFFDSLLCKASSHSAGRQMSAQGLHLIRLPKARLGLRCNNFCRVGSIASFAATCLMKSTLR
jgi:hypothetical protein